jgi:hypothetical protein
VGGVSKASALAASVVARRRKLRESCKSTSFPRVGFSGASPLSCNVTLPTHATSSNEMLVDEGAGALGKEDNSMINDTRVDGEQTRGKPAMAMAATDESVRLEEEDRAVKLSRAKKAILDAGEGADFGLSDAGKLVQNPSSFYPCLNSPNRWDSDQGEIAATLAQSSCVLLFFSACRHHKMTRSISPSNSFASTTVFSPLSQRLV